MTDKHINVANNIRNVAIVAHVDHGKTTLAESLIVYTLKHTPAKLLDSDQQEAQRGITILSKCASIQWKDHTINIMDTPGHRDFGSEVERVLGTGMVDGVLLIVDVIEGVMPQTQTVIQHAARNKLKFIIVVNKVDREGSSKEKARYVVDSVLDMLYTYTQDDDVLSSPVIYASGRSGLASLNYDDVANHTAKDISPLLDMILSEIPQPKVDSMEYVKCSVTMLDYDEYMGKICIGRVHDGSIKVKDNLLSIDSEGNLVEKITITKLFRFSGTSRKETTEVSAGDIYGMCGAVNTSLNDTIVSNKSVVPFESTFIEPPMLSVSVFANRSPMAGKEGDRDKINARHLQERLKKESKINPGMKIIFRGEETEIQSRGELQLCYLFENMIKEKYEFMVGSPKILTKLENGQELQPVEEVILLIPDKYIGVVMQQIADRNGNVISQEPSQEDGIYHIVFHIPTGNLFGFSSEFIASTSGNGRMTRTFYKYQSISGNQTRKQIAFMVAVEGGKATNYAMDALRDRGMFIVKPSTEVFKGMIVGICSKEGQGHLHINISKEKKLTNVRSAGKDEHFQPLPIQEIKLDDAITYICEPKVILEVTPRNIRLWYYE